MNTKTILSLMLCGTMLTACAQQHQTGETVDIGVVGSNTQKIDITGGIYNENPAASTPIVSNDPDVKVYPLDGPIENPLTEQKDHSVLDNTTAGGYTVFDDSVKVYPLPGEDVPAYVPIYSVPPLKNQYKPEAPMVGQQLTTMSGSTLPPVPTVEVGNADPFANPPVSGAVRQPLTLTNPEPLTMQAPSSARPAMKSPFALDDPSAIPAEASSEHDPMLPQEQQGAPRAPMLTSDAPMPMDGGTLDDSAATMPAPTPVVTNSVTAAGRKSGPLLTGY